MKTLHWLIFSLAGWILLVPFIGDDIIELILGERMSDTFDMVALLRWDDLFLGLAVTILALIAVTLEQGSHKTPGLKAMHWLQVVLGLWVAVAPFALEMDYATFTWSHFVTGTFIAIFALLQLNFE